MGSIERLEDLLRRYLIRRKTEGDVAVLDEDTKMASLESLLPKEMEQHVQLNRAKLTNYSLLRAEIVRYAEEKQTAIAGTVPKESKSPDDV